MPAAGASSCILQFNDGTYLEATIVVQGKHGINC